MATKIIRTETKVRSSWNKLWIFVLVAFNAWMAFEAISLSARVESLRRSASGFGHLAIGAIAGARFNELLLIWIGGTMLLGICVWLTRPTAVIIETREVEARPPPVPKRQPPMGWGGYIALLIVLVPVCVLAVNSTALARAEPAVCYVALALLWLLGSVAFYGVKLYQQRRYNAEGGRP